MTKSLHPEQEAEVRRDLLRKDAAEALKEALERQHPDVVAALIDHADESLRLHDQLSKPASRSQTPG